MTHKILHIAALLSCGFFLSASCGGGSASADKTPSVPGDVTLARKTATSLTYTWSASEGASTYEYLLTAADGVTVAESSTAGLSKSFTGLTTGRTYSFAVRAVGSGGVKSAYSTAVEGIPSDDTGDNPGGGGSETGSYGKYSGATERYADMSIPSVEESLGALAFPGAEGGGMYTSAGRGGAVYHVTNLNDSGEGSLRAAIETKGKRTIVFDVAGVIELTKALKIESGYGDVHIAGQTAPGDGICLKNYNFRINDSNVIIRYLHFRMGDQAKTEDDALNLYTGSDNIRNVIIDHCSLSWSTDECGTFYGMSDFTLQWCILSESLRNSIHDKGKHGYGGIWGGANATYHHNLLAHHDSRNPRLDHDYLSSLKGPISLVNNVIYNWGDNSTYGGESANTTGTYRQYNIINNYYRPGPATAAGKVRFIDPWTKACDNCTKKTGCSTIVPGHYYMNGNVMDGYDDKTTDNWTGTTVSDATLLATLRSASPFAHSTPETSLSRHDAQTSLSRVLAHAGASLSRDSVDERIVSETRGKTYTYTGSNGSTGGLIDSQSDVGGWPSYSATAAQNARTTDSDGDGIPDWWEEQCGLGKNDKSDGAAKTIDSKGRYTNLEMYLHYLVKDITSAQNQGGTYSAIK